MDVQDVECESTEEARQHGSALVTDPVEVWRGPRRVAQLEPERRRTTPQNRLREHLALAERHVSEGEKIIQRRERLIAELKRDGHDVENALVVLDTLIETQKAAAARSQADFGEARGLAGAALRAREQPPFRSIS